MVDLLQLQGSATPACAVASLGSPVTLLPPIDSLGCSECLVPPVLLSWHSKFDWRSVVSCFGWLILLAGLLPLPKLRDWETICGKLVILSHTGQNGVFVKIDPALQFEVGVDVVEVLLD